MNQKRQQGVAIITAMVITAIAVSIAATLVYKQQFSIRLAGNINSIEQAYQYATGMEDWAGIILLRDLTDNDTDSLQDDWATDIPPIPIPGGYMTGYLDDLQSRININALLKRQANSSNSNTQTLSEPHREALARLIDYHEGIEQEPLLDAMQDWLDADNIEKTNGAESRHYQTLTSPYVAANGPLASMSELLLIKGMTEEVLLPDGESVIIHQLLSPLLSALPLTATKINVNTAPYEVLYALGLDDTQVNNVIEDREQEAIGNYNDFLSSADLSEDEQQTIPEELISVSSEYFLLKGRIEIGNARLFLNSVIHRDNRSRKTRVLHREFSEQG